MKVLCGIFLAALLLLLPAHSFAQTVMSHNDLEVRFDLAKNLITGVSRISLPVGQTAKINFGAIKVTGASISGKALVVEPETGSITFTPETADDILKIEFEAKFGSLPGGDSTKNPGVLQGNRISPEGILLMDNWYPQVEGYSLYSLKALLPADFEGISEAEQISIREGGETNREFLFVFDHPLRSLTLLAGRYEVGKERHGDIDIFTYFFPEDRELSKIYIDYTKKYLDMYEKYMGKYPFSRFSVVENFFSAGYSYPSFTLLGKDIVKMPFVVETSLGHEVLHQWFGNLVYISDKGGNWAEGLTTYLADHMYEELKGRGWDYRKQALISFRSYVADGKDFPLRSFTGRMDKASAAIGYGKSAMVFHMLRKLVGEEIFFSSVRRFVEQNRFKEASWTEIKKAFETGYGKELQWFFSQWVDEGGVPELEIKDPQLLYRGAKVVVSFTLQQKGKRYKLSAPVLLKLQEGELREVFNIEKETTSLEIETASDNMPVSLILDDNYDLFRKLSDEESPPVVSALFGAEKKIFVLPQGKDSDYKEVSEFLEGEGFKAKKENEISYEDIKGSSLLVPDKDTAIIRRLLGRVEMQPADFSLVTRKNPFTDKGVIAVYEAALSSEAIIYLKRTTHYGKYGSLAFSKGMNVLKEVADSERGISTDIVEVTQGIEVPLMTDISRVIEKVASKDIIYVGELHDKFEHHRVQLQIITALHKKNEKIAIGMEMFQRPYQAALDDYIAGRTDEKTFLKKSEYFQRWGFDYNLYREILLFAREYKVPVIALNIRSEIVTKVSQKGLQALTDDEKKDLPEYLDLSDQDYRDRLRETFESHSGSQERNFDFFYESQVLWDESMAANLDAFISKNPDYKIVVLTGAGHMTFGSGIPKRSFRLNKRSYAVILNSVGVEEDVADFVLFPSAVPLPESPKLGVLLKAEDKKVLIGRVVPGSIADKAGLQEGDVILSLDDTPAESVEDVKIFLFFKKKSDEITVRVSRKKFLLGPTEKIFKITL